MHIAALHCVAVCAVTIATHMLTQTVYRFLGDPAPVAEANGVLCPRPHDECRSTEHCALGQDAGMGMIVILPPRQGCDLHCIVSSEASLTFSVVWIARTSASICKRKFLSPVSFRIPNIVFLCLFPKSAESTAGTQILPIYVGAIFEGENLGVT